MRAIFLLLAATTAVGALDAPSGFAEDPPATPVPAPAPPAEPVPSVSVPTYENVACPITGRPAARALYAETEWGRIYVCGKPCIPKVLADTNYAYRMAYPVTQQAKNRVCPVTGKPIGPDAVSVTLQGRDFMVLNQDCVAAARANSQIVLAKVNRPAVTDVGNTVCPITGKPVVDNAFCLVGIELIHLSDPSLVDEVRKDPVKALAAAKNPPPAKPAEPKPPKPKTKPGTKPPK